MDDGDACRFTMVPVKAVSDKFWTRNQYLKCWKLNIFECKFSTKVTQAFPLQGKNRINI